MPRQRHCKGAVGAVAVLGGEAGLRRIGDERVGVGRLDLGQATADAARSLRALHGLAERVVAAGIQDHQTKLLCRFDRNQDAVERKRLVVEVGVALELGIDWEQVIRAFDLDAVTGVVNHGDVGRAGRVGKVAQHAPHIEGRQIVPVIDAVETSVLQRLGHHRSVVEGVGERRRVLIGRVGKHQRDALSGECGLGVEQQRCGKEKRTESEQIAHHTT